MFDSQRILARLPAPPRPMPIGLDVGAAAVRMVQVEAGGEARVRAAASRRHDGEGWRSAGPAVADLLRGGKFKGRRVVAALPRGIARIKTVRLPGDAPAPDDAAKLAEEARAGFGVDLADGTWATHFLPGGPLRRGEGREGLLVAARRADVDEFVAALHGWGCEVAAIDLEPQALFRAVGQFGRRERDRLDATVVADVGGRATRVVIGRGGEGSVGFYKPLTTGGEAILRSVAEALGLSEAEAGVLCRGESGGGRDIVSRAVANARRLVVDELARELALCVRYYSVTFKGRPPGRVLLCGGSADGALRDALAAALAPTLPMDVDLRPPLEGMENEGAAAYGVAVGLALRFAGRLSRPGGPTRALQAEQDREAEELEREAA